jgi:hypothetical protein
MIRLKRKLFDIQDPCSPRSKDGKSKSKTTKKSGRRKSDFEIIDNINDEVPEDGSKISEKDRTYLEEKKEKSNDPNQIEKIDRKLRGSLPNPNNGTGVITVGINNK